MTNPYVPVIDLTDYSISDHDIQRNRSPRRRRGANRQERELMYPRIIYARRRIINEDPIVVSDSPHANTGAAVVKPRNVARKSNERKQDTQDSIDLERDRSPIVINLGICPICLETLGNQALVSTKCGHVYCQRCLTQSLRSEKRCPTCRKPLKGNTAYHPLYINRG